MAYLNFVVSQYMNTAVSLETPKRQQQQWYLSSNQDLKPQQHPYYQQQLPFNYPSYQNLAIPSLNSSPSLASKITNIKSNMSSLDSNYVKDEDYKENNITPASPLMSRRCSGTVKFFNPQKGNEM